MVNAPELRIPDIQVIVSASSFEVYVVNFYARADIHQGFEVLGVLPSLSDRKAVREILQACLTNLCADSWITVDQLVASAGEESDEPPF